MTPGPALLQHPVGLLWILGTVLALALGSAFAPLRGGQGQHTGVCPGALTVAGLLDRHRAPGPSGRREHSATVDEHSDASSAGAAPDPPLDPATLILHGPDRSPDSDWWDALGYWPVPDFTPAQRFALLNHPEYQPPDPGRWRPRHPISLVEQDLAVLLGVPVGQDEHPEPGYIGKHRRAPSADRGCAARPEWTTSVGLLSRRRSPRAAAPPRGRMPAAA
ncbi:hypothetical protein FHR84_003711 [Actinopolyspora biskrensis]|uniref:Uncharacterized protein n=1 Tax=Actinopolyspora biskrensis TaxID=1470178 RepID=A0A852YZ60_9ACTN|nr:hypothetical protein [Actinopolyspora biskrensis]NYH80354.1 hypothetical protein [Actinopolyspora biskrensis]